MPKFLILYHSPMTPQEAAPPDPEQMQEVMGQWMAWGDKVGSQMVDFGAPVANGVNVAPGGDTRGSSRDVSGYTFIEADDMDAALQLCKDHPHLDMPGSEIEVHEVLPVPGM